MRLNKHNLPDRVCQVIDGLNPPRPRPQKNIIHVTDLLLPAYAWNLYREKWDEIEEDYSDYLISVQGDALHEAYKKYLPVEDGWECEIEFEKKLNGVTIVGKCDAFNVNTGVLVDLKQTSVWNPGYKVDDYTKQTNCYAYLLQEDYIGVNIVKKKYIDVWYRNWKLADMRRGGHTYPTIPYEKMEIEVWPLEKTEQFIKDQIHYLLMCKDKCSRKDKWQSYACHRNNNQKPDRKFDTKVEAEEWIKNWKYTDSYLKNKPKGKITWKIVDTPPINCLHYCKARSVCPFNKGEMK